MDYKKHITKGEWLIYPHGNIVNPNHDSKKGDISTIAQCYMGINVPLTLEEAKANAQLIAEAGTVCNECGKTPRELLEERNSLIEALKDCIDFIDELKEHGFYHWSEEQRIKQLLNK